LYSTTVIRTEVNVLCFSKADVMRQTVCCRSAAKNNYKQCQMVWQIPSPELSRACQFAVLHSFVYKELTRTIQRWYFV